MKSEKIQKHREEVSEILEECRQLLNRLDDVAKRCNQKKKIKVGVNINDGEKIVVHFE